MVGQYLGACAPWLQRRTATGCSKGVRTSECEVPRHWNTVLQFSPPNTDTIPLKLEPHLWNHRYWCHLADVLKTYCEQANRRNFHVWNRNCPNVALIPDSAVRSAHSQQQLGYLLKHRLTVGRLIIGEM